MKLIAEFEEQKHELNFTRRKDNLSAQIDGRSYDFEISEPEPNVFLLRSADKVFRLYVSPNGIVNFKNRQFEVKISDPKNLRSLGAGGAVETSISEIKTAMPGKIIRILVERGATVDKGDAVIVVEAMKMQNEMKAPKDGTISEIRFAEGATVNAGDVLVIID